MKVNIYGGQMTKDQIESAITGLLSTNREEFFSSPCYVMLDNFEQAYLNPFDHFDTALLKGSNHAGRIFGPLGEFKWRELPDDKWGFSLILDKSEVAFATPDEHSDPQKIKVLSFTEYRAKEPDILNPDVFTPVTLEPVDRKFFLLGKLGGKFPGFYYEDRIRDPQDYHLNPGKNELYAMAVLRVYQDSQTGRELFTRLVRLISRDEQPDSC